MGKKKKHSAAPAAPPSGGPPGSPAAAGPPPPRPFPWRFLWIVVAVAGVVRLARLPEVLGGPERLWYTWDQTDSYTYTAWAREILHGNLLLRDVPRPPHIWEPILGTPEEFTRWEGGPNVFRHAPGYAYALAAVWAVVGESPAAVYLVQALLGIAWAVAALLLARRLFGDVAGLAAGLAAAIHGPALFLEGQVLRDAPALLFQVLGLLALGKATATGKPLALVGTGALLGATVILKEATGALAVAAVGWLAWRGLRRKVPGAARAAALVALGGALSFAPILARNLAVGARPFSLSTRAVQVLATTNAPDTISCGVVLEMTRGAGDVLRKSGGGGLATMLELARSVPPGRLIGGYVLRGIACWTPFEGPDNANYWYYRDRSRLLPVLPLFPCLVGPAVVGIVLAWRRRRDLDPLVSLVLVDLVLLAAVLPIGNPQCRYRIMLVPVLTPFAGLAVAEAVAAWRSGTRGRTGLLAAGALGVALVSFAAERALPAGTLPLSEVRQRPADFSVAAGILADQGARPEALAELDRGIGLFRTVEERYRLAQNKVALLAQAGDIERARAEAKRWAESEPHPGWAEVYRALGLGTPPGAGGSAPGAR